MNTAYFTLNVFELANCVFIIINVNIKQPQKAACQDKVSQLALFWSAFQFIR